jgi:predicted ribosomally synthesized peptide with nif11-like leader
MTTTTSTTMDRYLKFVEKVSLDTDLERKMAAIEPGNSAQIVELAAANGFAFTNDELRQASHEARVRLHQNENELSDEQLELVAGGSIGSWLLHKVRQAVDWIDNKVNGK